jgi:O-antigen/teichoic acid export membrane protein
LDAEQRLVATRTLQLSAFVVCFRLYQQVSEALLQAFGRYGYTSLVASAQSIVLNLGMVAVAWLGGSLIDMMKWCLLTASLFLIVSIALCMCVLAPYQVRFSFNLSKLTRIVRYSSTVWGVAVSSTLFGQMDKLIVGLFLDPSSVGIYALVTSIATKINSISAAVVQPLLPRISREFGRPQLVPQEIESVIRQGLLLSVGLAFGLGIGLFGTALYIMNAILPPVQAVVAVDALKLAALIYALYSANAVGYYVLIAVSPSLCLRIQLVATVASLVLIAVGAYYFGVIGAIAGNIGFVITWLLIAFAMSRLSIKFSTWVNWIRIPIIWFVVAAVTLLFADFRTFSGYAIGIVALVALYLWLGVQIGIHPLEISRKVFRRNGGIGYLL